MEKRPWVFVPAGPLPWKSHSQILPVLKKVWESAAFRIEPVFYPTPKLTPRLLNELKTSCSHLIFAIGHEISDSLLLLKRLRENGIDVPSGVMVASELTRGWTPFLEHVSVLNSSDVAIVNSLTEEKMVSFAFGSALRSRAIPLPVDENFKPLSDEKRTEFKKSVGVLEHDPMLVYAGRVTPFKNIHYLLLALAELRTEHPGAKLFILGPSESFMSVRELRSYLDFLSTLVVDLELTANVVFGGEVDQATLAKYLASCDAHLSASIFPGEDFGYSIAQGLACGSPTVVTNWGGGNDFVGGGAAIGVPVRVTDFGPRVCALGLIESLRKILRPDVNRKCRAHASSYAQKYLSCSSVKKRWTGAISAGETAGLRSRRKIEINPLIAAEAPATHSDNANFFLSKGTSLDLHLRISRLYAGDTPPAAFNRRRTYYLDPFFDERAGRWLDDFFLKREISLPREQVRRISGIKKGGIKHFAKWPKTNSPWMKSLVDSGIFLPAEGIRS